jgi:hypothetical protein
MITEGRFLAAARHKHRQAVEVYRITLAIDAHFMPTECGYKPQ